MRRPRWFKEGFLMKAPGESKILCIWIGLGLVAAAGLAGEIRRIEFPNPTAPIRLAEGLLKGADDATWGLSKIPGVEVKVIYRANKETGTFVNHPQLAVFKGRMYTGFQLCPANEDSTDSVAVYSSSEDMNTWSLPRVIGPLVGDETFRASVGWLQDEQRLYALMLRRDDMPPGKVTVTEYCVSRDGESWTEPQVLIPDMMGSANGRRISPDGRMLLFGHGSRLKDGECWLENSVYYNDGSDLTVHWQEATCPREMLYYGSANQPMARGTESDWYRCPDGRLVMVSRDIVRAGYILACVSDDQGASWTQPLLTNIPDSSNMQCAGNLPDGTCFVVTTPGPVHIKNDNLQPRTPLVLWLSSDGEVFDRAFLIRSTPPTRRFEGKSKTAGYSYAGTLVHDGYLYISYATNKEDIEMSCIPLNELKKNDL